MVMVDEDRPREPRQEDQMQDLAFLAATVAFFIFAIGYVQFCDRVK
jgi:hypothetical protein